MNKKLSTEDIFNFIIELETKFPVDKWAINGLLVWPLIRIKLYQFLLYKYSVTIAPNKKKSKFLSIGLKFFQVIVEVPMKHFWFSLINLKSTQVPSKEHEAIFLSDGVSFSLLHKKWFDKFCDPLIEKLENLNIKSLRLDPINRYHIPRYKPSIFIQLFINIQILKSIFHIAFFNKKKSFELGEYERFISFLKEREMYVDSVSSKAIQKQVVKIEYIKKWYIDLLDSTNSKIGFSVCYYGDYNLAFNLACRFKKIKCVDIQHGVQGKYHVAYSNWTKVPKVGYELLPDYFWCWSDYEVGIINKWASTLQNRIHEPVNGTYLFMDMWKDNNSAIVKKYDEIFSHVVLKAQEDIKVLVTLGWDLWDKSIIKDTLLAVKETQNRYKWYIRLHPTMLKDKKNIKKMFYDFGITNYNIDDATNLPLYALLRNIDIHVTHCSSSTIEAAYFGIPTILTDQYGKDLFYDQISEELRILSISFVDIILSIENFKHNTVVIRNGVNSSSNNLLERLHKIIYN